MKRTMKEKLALLVLLPLAALLTVGTDCEDLWVWIFGGPTDVTETPEEKCPWWDSDCDSISNATETNSANSYLFLDPYTPDANPSVARGSPCNGSIQNALNLMDQGGGYHHYNPDSPGDVYDWGVLHLIDMIELAGGIWEDRWMGGPRIGVGDMSLRNGGYFPPHSCHRNGLEADFRYIRNDWQEIGVNIAEADSVYFDEEKTLDAICLLMRYVNVELVYVDTFHCGLDSIDGRITHWPGHSDHLHVRIVDPDGTGN